MNEYNEERKFIEAQLTEEAQLQARELFSEEVALVAHGDGKYWNPGVVGIVAGKLANSLRKPCPSWQNQKTENIADLEEG